jgi:predicted Ser/Thr protein kinase
VNPGRVIGAYEVVALLGKGAMGAVYRARHRELGVERALKMIPYGRDAGRRARFAREARSLAAVSSEHVVRIHEAGEEAGEVYLVMDLVEGESLDRALARGRLPVVRALELVAALARGVAALHAAGIIHRDLKPENVLVRHDGAPVIVDLGLAVAPETDERLTRSGAVMGTPLFMAPEQLLGKPVTSAADVYALGLLTFALATGESATGPFESFPELVAQVALEDRPRPSSVDPDLPAALDDLSARLLARAPEQRPRAAEVAREVDRLLAALRTDTSESARAVKRRRGARAVGAALALVAALASAAALALGRGAPEPDVAASSAVATPTSASRTRPLDDDPEAARQLRRLERVEDPVARLEALQEWFARWPDHRERPAALALERAARVFVPLRLEIPDTFGAAFLDDARVVTASGGKLRVWDAATGAELPPLLDDVPTVNHATFVVLPRGAGLVWGAHEQVLSLAPGSSTTTRLATPHLVFSLAASPDGETLLAGHDGGGIATVLARRDGRALAMLGGHGHVVWSVAVSADGRHALTGTGVGVDHDGNTDNSVRLWSLERGGELVRREGLDARVTALAFVPGTDSFLVGNTGARVYRFRLDRPGPVQELASQESIQSQDLVLKSTAHRGGLRSLVVSADGRRAWTASGGAGPLENELRAWDLETGRERYRVLDRPAGFRSVRLSPDERRLVTWSEGGVVEVWATDLP